MGAAKAAVGGATRYYGRWIGRWLGDLWRHLWLTGVLLGVGLSVAFLGVDYLRASDTQRRAMSIGREAGSFGIVFALYLAVVATWFFFRAPLKLHQEVTSDRATAIAARDVAVAERDHARSGNPRMPVRVTRVEPAQGDPHSILLRVRVHNVGDRRATYSAEVVDIQGIIPGPETPYAVAWRDHDPALPTRQHSMVGDGNQMIDVALGAVLDAAQTRLRPADDWRGSLSVCVGVPGGRQVHPAPIANVQSVEEFLQREVVLTIVIVHEESQQHVARTKVRLWYREADGGLIPDLEIVD
jgi:hypothetical protein